MLTYSYIQIGLNRSTVICGIYILWKEMTKGENVCKMLLKRKRIKSRLRDTALTHCQPSSQKSLTVQSSLSCHPFLPRTMLPPFTLDCALEHS